MEVVIFGRMIDICYSYNFECDLRMFEFSVGELNEVWILVEFRD